MELLQLYYFQTTARCQQISAAARELHIAQPSLSQTIKRLETELGTPLFDRIGKQIRLNESGKIFLKYTDMILGAITDAKSELASLSKNPPRQVSFCVEAASFLLPDILEKFRLQNPDIQFRITQSAAAPETADDIDLILYSSVVPDERPGITLLLKEPLVAALPACHPLAKCREIRLCELSGESFASLCSESNLYKITRYYCSLAGFEPQISLSCDNPQAFRQLLGLNMGIALVPAVTWPDMSENGIVYRPVTDICCQRYLLLSRKNNRYLSGAATLFCSFLEQYFRKLV